LFFLGKNTYIFQDAPYPDSMDRVCTILLKLKKIIFFISISCQQLQIFTQEKIPHFRMKHASSCKVWGEQFLFLTTKEKSAIYNLRSTIPNRCDNCCFSKYMACLSRAALMCYQKTNFVGKWREVRLDDCCANFYPTTNFRLSLQTPRPIPLTRQKFTIVDTEDYYWLSQFKWHAVFAGKSFYAIRTCKGKSIKMHREIMTAPSHLFVDHIDHNGLNNCRSNLRLCSQAQNSRNTAPRKGGTSRYKGVCWDKDKEKWLATIQFNRKIYKLGHFTDEIAAARVYDERAKELHGDFACLNFP